jgi:hypothetical protein
MLALSATIGNFVADTANNETFQDAAHYHPVNPGIPYTTIPPDVSLPLSVDIEVARRDVGSSLKEHAQTTLRSNSGLVYPRFPLHEDIARHALAEVVINGRPAVISDEQWLAYTQVHDLEHECPGPPILNKQSLPERLE